MNAYLVVEDSRIIEILNRLLPPELLEDVYPVVERGTSAISLARTLLFDRGKPVALVRDAQTVDPGLVRERRSLTEELMQLAVPPIPWRVIQAIPAIEVVFFQEPTVLERYFGRKIPPELVVLGRRDPVGVLQVLAEQSSRPWNLSEALASLTPDEILALRSAPVIRELGDFLREAQATAKTAATASTS